MRIVIIGVSRVAEYLINYFEKSKHDIVVIDKDKKVIDYITDKYNVTGICGSGASREVLQQAGVDCSNYVISLTPIDEVNLLASSMSKNMGAKFVISILEREELINDGEYIKNKFGIDYVIVPNHIISQKIASQICYNVAKKVSFLFDNRLVLSELVVTKDSFFNMKKLKDIKPMLDINFLIIGVIRNDKLIVPEGDFMLKAGDYIGILTTNDLMISFFEKLELFHNPIKSLFIIGGGLLGEEILRQIYDKNIKITMIDRDFERCQYLLNSYKGINVICADSTDVDVYEKLDISNKSAFVCTTGNDETNLLSAIIAKSYDVTENISIVKTKSYEQILKKTMLCLTISTSAIISQKILEKIFSRKGDGSNYYAFENEMLKTFIFDVPSDFKFLGIPLKEQRLKKEIIIGAILRDDKVIIPNGNDVILSGDKVFVLSQMHESINSIISIYR